MPRKRRHRGATPAEESPTSPLSVEELLIAQIQEAFADVTLGSGIGLWQAQAIDDYADAREQMKARQHDEHSNWKQISPETLLRCDSSLSFFDADGMRFHLPAFMIDNIRCTINKSYGTDSVMYSLTDLSEFSKKRFTSLGIHHRKCVIAFLQWYLRHEETNWGEGGGSDGEKIIKALREFWAPEG